MVRARSPPCCTFPQLTRTPFVQLVSIKTPHLPHRRSQTHETAPRTHTGHTYTRGGFLVGTDRKKTDERCGNLRKQAANLHTGSAIAFKATLRDKPHTRAQTTVVQRKYDVLGPLVRGFEFHSSGLAKRDTHRTPPFTHTLEGEEQPWGWGAHQGTRPMCPNVSVERYRSIGGGD